ncbi:MAG TPA: PAS domain S-box protein [Terriglobales bacterium]|nr:PAS domain S-box protein [Terriglobales bacterium]
MEFLKSLFASNFLPHGTCYLWDPQIVWLHVISDGLIAVSYYCIPIALIYLVRKRRDLPFNWVFWMFGLFIMGCGTTHLMEVWTVWHGTYLLSGLVKLFTAVISVFTAVMLVPLIPKVVALPGPNQLHEINRQLDLQVAQRSDRERELMQLTEELERRVQRRTAELESINQALEKEIALGITTQQALRASQSRLSSVIESAMDAILTIDESQRIVLFNRAAEKMFAYNAREVLGQSLNRFIPERFRAIHSEHIHRFANTGVTTRNMGAMNPLWARRADGSEFPIEASISQTEDAGKRLFTVILRDVTERKQAEARNHLMATIVDSSHDAIVSKDLSGRILSWNKGAEHIYGYAEAEIVGKSVDLIVPPDQLDDLSRVMQEVAEGKMVKCDETARVRKDGTLLTVSLILSPMRDAEGRIIGISTIAHDITERKRDERALRELTQALDLAPVLVRDTTGRILLWNRGSEKFYGYTKTEALGTLSHALLRTQFPEPLSDIEEQLHRDDAWQGELVHRRKDGTEVVVSSRWALYRDNEGKPPRVVETNTDLTARKLAESKLRELNLTLEQRISERTADLQTSNKELEAFTYSVSHDLRAPLRHIVGFSKMLQETCSNSLSSEGQHYLKRIEDGTHRMGMLVDDLLNLTRIGRQELKLQAVNLDPILKDIIADLAMDTAGREIEWKISALPPVKGDPALLKMAFQNLLSNAAKYTRKCAKAVIDVGVADNVLFVRDNGVGFDMKYADKLFGVFQRLHRAEDFEGTGVGLATVQRIVQKHGGRIWAEAELGKGATFYLNLSFVSQNPASDASDVKEKFYDCV